MKAQHKEGMRVRVLIVDADRTDASALPRGALLDELDVPEARLRRLLAALAKEESHGEEDAPRSPYVRAACAYIEEHLADERLCAAQTARALRLSAGHLARVFKEETGMSAAAYIAGRRMREAERLLGDCRLRVYEVATAVGYRDVDSFTAAFSRHAGMSPGAYRASRGGEKRAPEEDET